MSEVYIFRVAYNICDGDTETVFVAASDIQRAGDTAMEVLVDDGYYSHNIQLTAIEKILKLDGLDKEWLEYE